jgi:hypothetical protein
MSNLGWEECREMFFSLTLTEQRREQEAANAERLVTAAREAGLTFGEIAAALGGSRPVYQMCTRAKKNAGA